MWVLTHPVLPREPLALLEVALTPRVASSIDEILDTETWTASEGSSVSRFGRDEAVDAGDDAPKCAMFYSISATQPGLAGINVGEQLIRRAAAAMAVDLPSLERFVTLSPIPGFRRWLDAKTDAFLPEERERMDGRAAADMLADLEAGLAAEAPHTTADGETPPPNVARSDSDLS